MHAQQFKTLLLRQQSISSCEVSYDSDRLFQSEWLSHTIICQISSSSRLLWLPSYESITHLFLVQFLDDIDMSQMWQTPHPPLVPDAIYMQRKHNHKRLKYWISTFIHTHITVNIIAFTLLHAHLHNVYTGLVSVSLNVLSLAAIVSPLIGCCRHAWHQWAGLCHASQVSAQTRTCLCTPAVLSCPVLHPALAWPAHTLPPA